MSSPHDSETQRAALDKAAEGWRLLSAGDYEGAIAACSEAIELDFSSLGARRTRAEAHKRLGRGNEAGVDSAHLGDASHRGNEESTSDDDNFWAISILVFVHIVIALTIIILNPRPEWGRGYTFVFILLVYAGGWTFVKLFPRRVMGASESVWRSLSRQELPLEAVVETPVERLELSPRTLNCLKRAQLTKVGEILEMSDDELLKIRGFGDKSLSELREKLAERGIGSHQAEPMEIGGGPAQAVAVGDPSGSVENLSLEDIGELLGAGNGPLPAPELTDEDLSRQQDEDEDDEEEEEEEDF